MRALGLGLVVGFGDEDSEGLWVLGGMGRVRRNSPLGPVAVRWWSASMATPGMGWFCSSWMVPWKVVVLGVRRSTANQQEGDEDDGGRGCFEGAAEAMA